MIDYLYHYKALVVGVYDGDSITCDIDLGFGIWMRDQKLRLYGIDTPELRGDEREEGLRVRDIVRARIHGKDVTLRTYKDKTGKYGRWLADVLYDESGKSLNQQLIEEGNAKPYML